MPRHDHQHPHHHHHHHHHGDHKPHEHPQHAHHAAAEGGPGGRHHGPRGHGHGPRGGRGGGGFGFDNEGGPRGRKVSSDDLQLLLLALIGEQPSHGYELIKALEQRSNGFYVPSPGMMYPALACMEDRGHVTIQLEGNRKRYALSEEGSAHLEANREHVDLMLAKLAAAAEKMRVMRSALAEGGEGRREFQQSGFPSAEGDGGVVGAQQPPGRHAGEGQVEQGLVALALDQLGRGALGPDGLADPPSVAAAVGGGHEVAPGGDDPGRVGPDLGHVGERDPVGVAAQGRPQQPDLGPLRPLGARVGRDAVGTQVHGPHVPVPPRRPAPERGQRQLVQRGAHARAGGRDQDAVHGRLLTTGRRRAPRPPGRRRPSRRSAGPVPRRRRGPCRRSRTGSGRSASR